MSHRLMQILETYKRLYNETGKEQPMIKPASYVPSPSFPPRVPLLFFDMPSR
jgi:hypothetical protein